MTIFCVKSLLLAVISKNIASPTKHPRHVFNFKVYGSTLRRGCSLKLTIIAKLSI